MLREHYPDHAILGEEGGVSGDPSSGLLWCVDPLDGTTNFTHHYPAFAGSPSEVISDERLTSCWGYNLIKRFNSKNKADVVLGLYASFLNL